MLIHLLSSIICFLIYYHLTDITKCIKVVWKHQDNQKMVLELLYEYNVWTWMYLYIVESGVLLFHITSIVKIIASTFTSLATLTWTGYFFLLHSELCE